MYRDAAQVRISDHGEYGPTLTWRDQAFTGAADIKAGEGTWTSSSGRVYKTL
jgi:hypothetical protein